MLSQKPSNSCITTTNYHPKTVIVLFPVFRFFVLDIFQVPKFLWTDFLFLLLDAFPKSYIFLIFPKFKDDFWRLSLDFNVFYSILLLLFQRALPKTLMYQMKLLKPYDVPRSYFEQITKANDKTTVMKTNNIQHYLMLYPNSLLNLRKVESPNPLTPDPSTSTQPSIRIWIREKWKVN